MWRRFDGLRTEEQLLRDAVVRVALRDQRQDLALAPALDAGEYVAEVLDLDPLLGKGDHDLPVAVESVTRVHDRHAEQRTALVESEVIPLWGGIEVGRSSWLTD